MNTKVPRQASPLRCFLQIELLSPKQNGSTASSHEPPKAHSKASIKGMWKKAFKSLKTDSKGSTKDKEDRVDRQEGKYSRMVSRIFVSFCENIFLRARDSVQVYVSNDELSGIVVMTSFNK